ncbi:MFS general substrate transporter [Sparassis latifolia]|uniref:Major facilitator superfamily domain-containing protein n=1 Tax=Sparassis crispa TaxID=139825 RepID=A0A401GC01_9APHY|nr:Major facilitator superfamily domain-containing protein [Sparassis crispa]GBE79671.1 Major facilitator superfamily domain-containing protein [Sparassis crispa]
MANIERIVFLSLVLDLFAFTIPLPLFPRIIEWYTKRESSDPSGFLSRTLFVVSSARSLLYEPKSNPQRWDIVLLGGLMGSVFSALQWFIAPYIGSLSDKYGRKRVLLVTMIGNILSALVWLNATTFAVYMLSRVIGGISEGNVQLAIAILSDVTTPANRSKALAHVGIAFAICFCIGPPIGAYFASRPLPTSISASGFELNVYATPAFITLVLLVLETIFLIVALPETRGKGAQATIPKKVSEPSKSKVEESPSTTGHALTKSRSVEERLSTLKALRNLHFLFLGIFSGVEFTLTFLTFDLFDWNNKQNGTLIGSIGIISALLQGGYVRRAIPKIGEAVMARRGVSSCAVGLVLLTLIPHALPDRDTTAVRLLQGAAVCMAFTSATVVNSLTSFASLQCDDAVDEDTGKPVEEHPELAKGKALGRFRSSGQLGRAIGPLLACASYWTFGPSLTYAISAAAMFALSASMKSIATHKTVAAS